ncbi:hypothetical protein PG996_014358 [Apiospora saccharicola]|uniref:2EXR domain-containing protein n=1 Tax=Apiospora saccharicola TaxID=335842 RepID=A0ABR1TKS4_9PEZI
MSGVNQHTRYRFGRPSLRISRNTVAFDYFPKLPPELRHKIWDAFLLDKELTPECGFIFSPILADSVIRFRTHRQPNPLLFVNRESRARALCIFSLGVPVYRGALKTYKQYVAAGCIGLRRGDSTGMLDLAFRVQHRMASRGTIYLSPVVDRTVFESKTHCTKDFFAFHWRPNYEGPARDELVKAPWCDLWFFGEGEH